MCAHNSEYYQLKIDQICKIRWEKKLSLSSKFPNTQKCTCRCKISEFGSIKNSSFLSMGPTLKICLFSIPDPYFSDSVGQSAIFFLVDAMFS